jgi:hypothetical protein
MQHDLQWSRNLLVHAGRICAAFDKEASNFSMPCSQCQAQRCPSVVVLARHIRTVI